ncbi:MAG TPA: lipase maturation factor family protein [Candidatus Polarisedimenticolia bacterium]|jgi:hypothetical protein|nr:lipase maturation factor family protein [Candidatus Polarisedimenticolia bacterium]
MTGRDSYAVSSSLFLRALGAVYVFAFASLAVQVKGLAGHDGLMPADVFLQALRTQVGPERYWDVPTLLWLTGPTDFWLVALCWIGTAAGVMIACGILPGPCLAAAWVLFLSLASTCRTFLNFQWDALLCEAGFLALLCAPWSVRLRPGALPAPAPPAQWLVRWLLFRLMFSSGVVKLASGDDTWWNLRALDVHYMTQPLPTWTAWWAHQAPRWFHTCECAVMFFIELVTPFFVFAPRLPRRIAAGFLIGFQVVLIATGNYAYFNYLTIALCLMVLDDDVWPLWLRRGFGVPESGPTYLPAVNASPESTSSASAAAAGSTGDLSTQGFSMPYLPARHWPIWFSVPVVGALVILSTADMTARWRFRLWWPSVVEAAADTLRPLRIINAYGLFAAMTTTRNEIVVEGSDDGQIWQAYEFRFKPGDPMRAPRFVAPHQPRLDWQMWFAALSSYRSQPWFQNFLVRLLQGSPDVLALLQRNPFPDHPPRYIRSRLYDYRFTDLPTRRSTGAWWERTEQGLYSPVQSLRPAP